MRISDWSSDVCSSDLHDVLFSFSLSRNVPGKPVWLFSETESPNGTSGIGPPKSKIWRSVLMTVVNKDEIEPSPRSNVLLTEKRCASVSSMPPRSDDHRVGYECVSTF